MQVHGENQLFCSFRYLKKNCTHMASSSSSTTQQQQQELEHALIRPPLELLNKSFRTTQKFVEKELSVLEKAAAEMAKKKNVSNEDAGKYLEKISARLLGIKRKITETDLEEEQELQVLKRRLEHVQSYPVVPSQAAPESQWQQFCTQRQEYNKTRLSRMIADYFLRTGYYDAAIAFAETAQMKDLLDVDIFVKSRKIVADLEKQNCTEALTWCTENKSKLKKMKSTLEFQLRLQEFVELIRKDAKQDAIQYARKILTPLACDADVVDPDSKAALLALVQQAMALLAFGKHTTIPTYRNMLDMSRWQFLVQMFKTCQFELYGLTSNPILYSTMQAGLSVLKTPQAYLEEHYNMNHPFANAHLQTMAEKLPFAYHAHSKLVCRLSGKLMDDKNPPMALPNGNVYSLNAIQEEVKKSVDRLTFVDPRTNEAFPMDQLKK